jgi:hypothetical protein
MRTSAALPFGVIDVQTCTDSFDVRFVCSGDHSLRAAALAEFERVARQVYGRRALSMFASRAAETCGFLEIPFAAAPDLPSAAALISTQAYRAGLQPFVLPVLDAQVARDLWDRLGHGRISDPLNVDVTTYLAATAAVQARWAAAIDLYLALDAASGSCSHPDLVRELHVGRPPLEHWVLRALLGDTTTIGRGRAKRLSYWDGFCFADVPLVQMTAALAALGDSGWTESARFDVAGSRFAVARGPLLRRLSRRFLLKMPAQMLQIL